MVKDAAVADVVRVAAQQRAAAPDEPVCVICGRYGEYICDATDEDVCSLECRDVCTARGKAPACEDTNTTSEPLSPSVETTRVGKRKPADEPSGAGVGDDDVARGDAIAAEVRKRLGIHVQTVGRSVDSALPPLCDSFDSLPEELRKNMAARGLECPTPVQMQAIPAALMRRHLLVSAPTGTGKTAAFLVPLVVQIMELRWVVPGGGPLGLVLAPIRELAIQIEHEAKALMKGIAKMKTALVVGGMPLPPQLHRLRQGVQLVVATPGRLADILVQQEDDGLEQLLDHVQCCVVDEVDMMLSVGFREVVTQILTMLMTTSPSMQLIVTSATVSNHIEDVVSSFLDPSTPLLRIRVGDQRVKGMKSSVTINQNVDHSLRWLEENHKKTELFHTLERRGSHPTLVFVGSREGADMLAQAIEKQLRLRARSFHAGKSQQERLNILEEFVNEQVQVLISTNVLGRGIDMLTVDLVVIFDAPKTMNDYVHLIGRVGRESFDGVKSHGASVLYVNARDHALFPDLVPLLQHHQVQIPKEVYASLRSTIGPRRQQNVAPVAADSAKRAFRVINELERDDLSDRAAAWVVWKYSAKRSRHV